MLNTLILNQFKYFINDNKKNLIIYTIFLLSYSPLEILLFSYVMVLLYEKISKNKIKNSYLSKITCILFFIVVIIRLVKKKYETFLIPKLLNHFRYSLYENVVEQSKKIYKDINTSPIITSLISISNSLQNIIFNLFSMMIPRIFCSIFIVICLLFINPNIGCISICYSIIIIFILYYLFKKCYQKCKDKIIAFNLNNSIIEDSIKNINSIIISNFKNQQDDVIRKNELNYQNKFISSLNCSFNFNFIFTIAIVFYFSICIHLTIKNKTISYFNKTSSLIFVSYLTAFSKYLFDQFPVLINDYLYLKNSENYYQNITNIKSAKIKLQGNLSLKNISLSIDNIPIFNNLNLNIYPKDKIIIKGDSGSGKSTLFKLILGYSFNQFKGNYYIENKNINDLDIDFFRQQINYTEQYPKYLNNSIINIIKSGTGVSYDNIQMFIRKYKIKNLQKIINIKNIGNNGYKLSGGQKQMISIIKSFIIYKPLVLLDEPSSNLDNYHVNILNKIIDDSESTIIIVSHDSRLLNQLKVKNIYVLKNKKIKKLKN